MSTGGKRVLLTDLDNTLWDWFDAWHASFSAMLNALIEDSGVPRDVLETQIRAVHQKYGTTEYSNLVNEIPALVEAAEGREPWRAFPRAIEALRVERRRHTLLYPGVAEGLAAVKQAGLAVIAYTESLAYWTEWRLRRTGLDGVIDCLYSSQDHDLPRGMTVQELRSRPDDYYGLKLTEHRHVPRGAIKPNVEVLKSILDEVGFQPHEAVYIGDSLMKDVAMAQEAKVSDVHARYGEAQHRPEYALLRRVTHWTDEDVERERAISSSLGDITATHTCEAGFRELLPVLGLP